MQLIDTSYLLNGALIAGISVLIGWILGALKGGAKTAMKDRDNRREHQDEEMKAMKHGMRELLYAALMTLYEKASSNGFVTVQEFSHTQAVYTAYHTLGGNGRGTKLWEEYQEFPIQHSSDPSNRNI